MACYLKNRFPSHSVDVEYDRVRAGGDRKRLGPRCVELDLFIPDLIVHKRGDNERNLLAVECKLDRGDGINRDQKLPRQISVAEGRFRELEGCYWLVGNYYSSVAAQARMRLRNGASLLLRCKGVEALMAWRSSAARACGRRSSVPHTMRT